MTDTESFAKLSRAQFGAVVGGYVLISVVLAAFCMVRAKSLRDDHTPGRWNWARINLLLCFVSSLLFALSALTCFLLLVYSGSISLCKAAAYVCSGLYGNAKLLTYLYLIEKVRIVWHPFSGRPRIRSPEYLAGFVPTALYIPAALVTALLRGDLYGTVREDGQCVVISKNLITIQLLVYDAFMTVLLTGLFLWPLLRRSLLNAGLRSLTRRTLAASTISLSATMVNVAILLSRRGTELVWVWMGAFSLDIIVGAMAIFWTTRPAPRPTAQDEPPPTYLPLSFARVSKDTVNSLAPHGHERLVGPHVIVSHLAEVNMPVILSKDLITPHEENSATTLMFANKLSV